MIARTWKRVRDMARLFLPSARSLVGRRYLVVVLAPLLWPAFEAMRLLVGWRTEDFAPYEAQVRLIGLPIAVLAILLGVRIIAGEVDRRTLEIAYTVPGGAHRVWLAKLAAAVVLLVAAEALLAAAALLFTDYPAGALYGALQAAAFYLALSMTLAAFFRGEASGALVAVAVLILNGFLTGFGNNQLRISPMWNPAFLLQRGSEPADVLAWTVQNRIGFLLAVAAVVAIGFARAERRERMLGS